MTGVRRIGLTVATGNDFLTFDVPILSASGIASPFRTAEAFNIEDIIDPRETRPVLCDFVETAQDVLRTQLGPSAVPYQP